jgi:hypothetical protein
MSTFSTTKYAFSGRAKKIEEMGKIGKKSVPGNRELRGMGIN